MNMSISTIFKSTNKYTLVLNDKNTYDRVLHFNNIYSHDDTLKTVIPVFHTLYHSDKFKKDVIDKNKLSKWYVSKDNSTNEAIFYTEVKKYCNNNFVKIQETYFEEDNINNLFMYEISLFYIDDFWFKSDNNHLVVTGNLWNPVIEEKLDIELAKEVCEKKYYN